MPQWREDREVRVLYMYRTAGKLPDGTYADWYPCYSLAEYEDKKAHPRRYEVQALALVPLARFEATMQFRSDIRTVLGMGSCASNPVVLSAIAGLQKRANDARCDEDPAKQLARLRAMRRAACELIDTIDEALCSDKGVSNG